MKFLFIIGVILVTNVLSNPSPKKKQTFDSEFLKTGVNKEARCKADQSTLVAERDELLGKVDVLQKKINALQCQQDKKKVGAALAEDFCNVFDHIIEKYVKDQPNNKDIVGLEWLIIKQLDQLNVCVLK